MSPPSRKRKPADKRDSNDAGSGDDGGGENEGDDEGFLNTDIDEEKLYDPGFIKVSDPSHRRLLEETGNDDNWRVVFTGDAVDLDEDDSNNEADNNE